MYETKALPERERQCVIAPWVAREFSGVELGDQRLGQRAQIIMTQFSQQPGASIPQACGPWGDIKAAYRFFDNDAVKPEQLLEPHRQATLQRMQAQVIVLAVQDTTSLNYSTHPQTEGLGPISNNADKTIGLLVHSTLALTLAGQPLGLLDVQVRSRDRRHFGQGHTGHQRNRKAVAEKESQRWLDSLRACQAAAQACPQSLVVNVADREGDIYELFEQALASGDDRDLVLTEPTRSGHTLRRPFKGMKPRVLVVDDESDFIQLLKYNLENQGFEILAAHDGVEALNLARRELPDVVLMDLMLPDIDGFSVCEILRSQPSTAKVPIIVVSALDGEYVRSRGIQAGVAGCFKKPVDMKVLGETIRASYQLRQESIRSELAEDNHRRK